MQRMSRIIPVAAALALVALTAPGCSDECKRSSDCPAGFYCVRGSCRRFPDPGADADADVTPDVEDDADVTPDVEDDSGADADGDAPGPDVDADGDVEGEAETRCTTHEECADDNPCTVNECLMAEGTCRSTPMADGEPCNDGVFCNGFEVCAGGICVSTGNPCSASADPCGTGACDEASHSCRLEPATDGAPCDNGFYCDGADSCLAGVCTSGGSPCPGGDGVCSFAICDEDTDTCSTTSAPDGTNCDDGNPCNGSDVCLAGACAHEASALCTSFITCEVGVCSPDGAGGFRCDYVGAPVGTACTDTWDTCGGAAGRLCVEGSYGIMCGAGTDALCSDGSLCNVTICRDGTCLPVTPRPTPPDLACGGEVSGDTATGANDVSAYGATCGSDLTGGERAYAVAVPAGMTTLEVTLTPSGTSGTLVALVLSDLCTATSCLAASTGGPPATVTATVTGGRTYYVVVDGQAGARGAFRLVAMCR